MHFSKIISALKEGGAGLQEHQLGENPEIHSGASLEKAESNQICFLEEANALINQLDSCKAAAVLIQDKKEITTKLDNLGIPWAICKDPRLAFAETLELLNPPQKPIGGIHSTAVIGEKVVLGKNIFIGPNVCIGNECEVGDGTVIHPGVVIYEKVKIGKGSELHANCVIHPRSKIGSGCVIHSNAVIGSEGFGFVPTERGWRKMPQTGIVTIEDHVEIGCGTTVDRPAVGETRIGMGTKVDNLVQIGHGVITGKSCAMASQVGIAGGAQLGNGVILAGQVGVGNRVKVGDKVIASSKCGIHADIEPGQVVSGFPAIPNRQWLRCAANFKKLPDIAKAVKEISNEYSH